MKSLFFSFLLLCISVLLHAQPGTIDLSFGNNGFVAGSGISIHISIGQQHSGKLVTAGGYSDLQFNGYGNFARFLPDGMPDSSFGVNGFVLGAASPYEMVLQPDDKMVIVGTVPDSVNPQHGHNCVARYQPDGRLDLSFGNHGITLLPEVPQDNYYNKIKLETDGSIVIGGEGFIGVFATTPSFTFLSHLSADGLFDFKFGKRGIVVNQTATAGPEIGIQKDGKILLAGNTFLKSDYVLSRYNNDGTIDVGFGNKGTVVTEGVKGASGTDHPVGLAVQTDGKIVIGGNSSGEDFNSHMAALRYKTNGTLDSSFGNGGKVFVSFADNYAAVSTILLQPDGKIVLSGGVSDYVEGALALCRLNTNGTLDSSFAVNGKQLSQYSGGSAGTGCALLQKDGKIVQGGEYYNDSTGYNASLLVRYNGDSKKQIIVAKVKRWLQNHTLSWNGLPAEYKIAYYNVEQSPNSSKGFTPVAKVSGVSNLKEYSITNNSLLQGTNYYRIKAVSTDGTIRYSEVVSADNTANTATLYPNPARNYVMVTGLNASTQTTIIIKDDLGKIIAIYNMGNASQYKCDVSKLTAGVYYLQINSAGKTEVLKFIKE